MPNSSQSYSHKKETSKTEMPNIYFYYIPVHFDRENLISCRHVFSIPKFDSRLPRDGARSFVTSVPDVTTLHTAISDFQDVENKVSSRK